ncbi:MAG: polysaccharide deacetylase family protein [Pseudomonadota bacterium]
MNPLWPLASLLTGNLVRTRGPRTGGAVYLTFDDGPHPQHTASVLEVLARHGAKGSFFLIGREAERFPELVRRILAEGHSVGSHSMFHPRMRGLGARVQWSEIDRADLVLEGFDGRRRHAFRPPNGRVTLPILAAGLWRRQPLVLWTIDSHDYELGPDGVIQRLQKGPPTDGDVILFHDDGACAATALQALLPVWRAGGLSFPALG